MLALQKSQDRFVTRFGWLDSRHAFSFGHHFDLDRMGHGPLRVINEDWIAPRSGFPSHPHQEMEILTYVLGGRLTHRDSAGNEAEITPGRAQLMHAGTGIVHSEMNLDPSEAVHLLQIWIEPGELGTEPGHEELDFELTAGSPVVLASPGASGGGLAIRQDATVSALALDAASPFEWSIADARRGWLQWTRGSGRVGDLELEAGDAVAVSGAEAVVVEATEASEMLLFDLP